MTQQVLLDEVRAADDLYFDAVSKVTMPGWSTGRVAVVGDAASCVSLFGDGSTLAMIAAATLAEELAATPADHLTAFRRYEARHRRLTGSKQQAMPLASRLLVPSSAAGIAARNAMLRAVSRIAGQEPLADEATGAGMAAR